MKVLGIESSCDDLSIAIVEDGEVLASATASQVKDHAPYGGVVPEIASRRHLEALEPTLHLALKQGDLSLRDIQGIAATYAPGLVGSLLVGLQFAKTLAYTLKLPFRAVHHLEGHLCSGFLEQDPIFPLLGLVVSGGHSHLYRMTDFGNYELLGHTVDDAAGEAFDKIAKKMGLPYPGGPAIDALSVQGNPESFLFALPKVKGNLLHTSFSGMKTAALEYIQTHVQQHGFELSPSFQADLSASFQFAAVRALRTMVERAIQKFPARQIVVTGGVACNRALRQSFSDLSATSGIPVLLPSPKYCTDNGAMIAWVGEKYLARGDTSPLSINALARAPLGLQPLENL